MTIGCHDFTWDEVDRIINLINKEGRIIMIHNKQILASHTIDACLVSMQQVREGGPLPSRFKSVVDSKGYECGAVTDQYQLVRNADLIAAADLASDKLGVPLEAVSGRYIKGRSRYRFFLPDTYKVPDDPSDMRMQFDLRNSYGCTNMVTGTLGAFRVVCTNGMVIGKVAVASRRKHTQNLNVMDYVEDLLATVVARAEAYKLIAEITASMAFEYRIDEAMDEAVKAARRPGHKLLTDIAKDTPKRYHQALKRAIRTNREEIGRTIWALLQAVSEVATHDMRDTWARDDWQARQVARIHTYAGV